MKRFWSKVDKTGECWLWTASTTYNGYGQFAIESKPIRAHRYSYELANGEFDKKLYVLHKCDNRICVRPSHLHLGTHKDNMKEMRNKGRSLVGEKHHNAKLTDEDVRAIKKQLRCRITQRVIADNFGVSEDRIQCINTGKAWGHIDE